MHFEVLVEDRSGKVLLEKILPRLIMLPDTYTIHDYKGIGRIPRGLNPKNNPRRNLLLNNIPNILQGLGKTFQGYGPSCPCCVIVVCDLDQGCLKEFRHQLDAILTRCRPRPEADFCIAVEEMEAWLLGDQDAILTAYPNANRRILENYEYDSIVGTWEVLAKAIHEGDAKRLIEAGYPAVGTHKAAWAERIAPHLEPSRNQSPSFQRFCAAIRARTS